MDIGVKDAAKLLKVSEKTIYRWVSAKQLPYTQIGGQYRFSRSRLLQWALLRRSVPHGDSELPATISVSLAAAVELGGIHYRVAGADIAGVLQQVLRLTHLPETADRGLLLRLLEEREALCSSGVGNGLALPHPRYPVLAELEHPLLSVNFLETPVDFAAIDAEPVHALFLILSPSVGSHLQLMSKLSYALRQQSFRDQLREPASREALRAALHNYDQQLCKDSAGRSDGGC